MKKLFFAIATVVLLLSACKRDKPTAKKSAEVNQKGINVDIVRFERDWYAMNPKDVANSLKQLQAKYPTIYEAYYYYVMEFQKFGDENAQLSVIQKMLTNTQMLALYDSTEKTYPNLDFLEKDLKTAFANYKSYYPEKPIPQVFTCITQFAGFPAFTFDDSILGICIDDHLGKDYIYYPNFFYEYQLTELDKKYMSVNAINVMAQDIVPAPAARSTLLDKMLAYGKMLFFIQSLLPEKSPAVVMRYTDEQWQWCVNSEKQIWSYFLDKELLYNTDQEGFKYVQDAPTTYGMPNNAPGRVGAWLGWQIINAYVEQNPNVTLKELINLSDSQKILEASKYKPKQ